MKGLAAFQSWLSTAPAPVNPAQQQEPQFDFGRETGTALQRDIADSLVDNEHVLIVGPRGSGKSRVASEAIDAALATLTKTSDTLPGASIMLQGNKELPRDYLFEPEYEFRQNDDGTIAPSLRAAPILRFARGAETGTIIYKNPEGPEPYRPIYEITRNNDTIEIKRFFLFLDEINRFNDGVLDSLLLLMEEGMGIIQAKRHIIPITLIATMNPPDYDASARALSPPLLSRFSRTIKMYTPGVATLANFILKDIQAEQAIKLRIAFATLCFWGSPTPGRSSTAYLSRPTMRLLRKARDHHGLAAAMSKVADLCTYGPDARAARTWIVQSRSLAKREGTELTGVHFKQTLVQAVANKLVLNFSPDAKPDVFAELIINLEEIVDFCFRLQLGDLATIVNDEV